MKNREIPAVHKAVQENDLKSLERLLEFSSGNDPDAKDEKGLTALHYAVQQNNLAATRLLLNAGVSINEKDEKASTALHYATRLKNTNKDNLEIIRLLITHGGKLDEKDSSERTALHYATIRNDLEAIQLLINAGADVNAEDHSGLIPLHIAAYEARTRKNTNPADLRLIDDIIKFLLSKGARPDQRGKGTGAPKNVYNMDHLMPGQQTTQATTKTQVFPKPSPSPVTYRPPTPSAPYPTYIDQPSAPPLDDVNDNNEFRTTESKEATEAPPSDDANNNNQFQTIEDKEATEAPPLNDASNSNRFTEAESKVATEAPSDIYTPPLPSAPPLDDDAAYPNESANVQTAVTSDSNNNNNNNRRVEPQPAASQAALGRSKSITPETGFVDLCNAIQANDIDLVKKLLLKKGVKSYLEKSSTSAEVLQLAVNSKNLVMIETVLNKIPGKAPIDLSKPKQMELYQLFNKNNENSKYPYTAHYIKIFEEEWEWARTRQALIYQFINKLKDELKEYKNDKETKTKFNRFATLFSTAKLDEKISDTEFKIEIWKQIGFLLQRRQDKDALVTYLKTLDVKQLEKFASPDTSAFLHDYLNISTKQLYISAAERNQKQEKQGGP